MHVNLHLKDLPYIASLQVPDLCALVLTVSPGGGDTFDCYLPDEDVIGSGQTLAKGTSFTGSWKIASGAFGVEGKDFFASYTTGDKVGVPGLNNGSGFAGSWAFTNDVFGLAGLDSFASYTTGDKVGVPGLNAGTGFSTDWTFANG